MRFDHRVSSSRYGTIANALYVSHPLMRHLNRLTDQLVGCTSPSCILLTLAGLRVRERISYILGSSRDLTTEHRGRDNVRYPTRVAKPPFSRIYARADERSWNGTAGVALEGS